MVLENKLQFSIWKASILFLFKVELDGQLESLKAAQEEIHHSHMEQIKAEWDGLVGWYFKNSLWRIKHLDSFVFKVELDGQLESLKAAQEEIHHSHMEQLSSRLIF